VGLGFSFSWLLLCVVPFAPPLLVTDNAGGAADSSSSSPAILDLLLPKNMLLRFLPKLGLEVPDMTLLAPGVCGLALLASERLSVDLLVLLLVLLLLRERKESSLRKEEGLLALLKLPYDACFEL